ncbi:MAG: metallophosphoesterase, partial [Ruminococcus sp.]|nr:metallophosphoesterase [Ruminococcus sp.]
MIIKKGKIDSTLPRDYIARIGLFSDVHVGYTSWGDYSKLTNVINGMNAKKPDFCVILGDCIDSGYERTPELMAEQKEILNTHLTRLKSPCFKMRGNHDSDVSSFTDFGVITFNGLRFVCIFPKYVQMEDTSTFDSRGRLTEDDIEWISEKLKEGDGYTNVILSHYCIVEDDPTNFKWPICDTVTNYNGVVIDGHRDELMELLSRYGVDLFINGHEHKDGLINKKVDDTDMTDVQI